jgi:hypothetical protein
MEIRRTTILRILIQIAVLAAVLIGTGFCVPAVQLHRHVERALDLNTSSIPERAVGSPVALVGRHQATNYSRLEDVTSPLSSDARLYPRTDPPPYVEVPVHSVVATWLYNAIDVAMLLENPHTGSESEYKTLEEVRDNGWTIDIVPGVSEEIQQQVLGRLGLYDATASASENFWRGLAVQGDITMPGWRTVRMKQDKPFYLEGTKVTAHYNPTNAAYTALILSPGPGNHAVILITAWSEGRKEIGRNVADQVPEVWGLSDPLFAVLNSLEGQNDPDSHINMPAIVFTGCIPQSSRGRAGLAGQDGDAITADFLRSKCPFQICSPCCLGDFANLIQLPLIGRPCTPRLA